MMHSGKLHKTNLTAGRKKLRYWLLLFAVVFQISVPLAQGLSAPVIAGNDVPAAMICGATGGVTQIPENIVNQNATKNTGGQNSPCPFCHSCCFARAFSLDYVKVELPIMLVPDMEKWVYGDFAGTWLSSKVTGLQSRPRAPPAFT